MKKIYVGALLAASCVALQAMEPAEHEDLENGKIVIPTVKNNSVKSLKAMCEESFGYEENTQTTKEYLWSILQKQKNACSGEEKLEIRGLDCFAAAIVTHASDSVIQNLNDDLFEAIHSSDMPEFSAAVINRLMKLFEPEELLPLLYDTNYSLIERHSVAKNMTHYLWHSDNHDKSNVANLVDELLETLKQAKPGSDNERLCQEMLTSLAKYVSKDLVKKIVRQIASSGTLSPEIAKVIMHDRLQKDELYKDYFKGTFFDAPMMQKGNDVILFDAVKAWWKRHLHEKLCSGSYKTGSSQLTFDNISQNEWREKYKPLKDKKATLILHQDPQDPQYIVFSYAGGAVSGKIPQGIQIGSLAINEETICDLAFNDAQDKLAIIARDKTQDGILFLVLDYAHTMTVMFAKKIGFLNLDSTLKTSIVCVGDSWAYEEVKTKTGPGSIMQSFGYAIIKPLKQPDTFLEFMKLAWVDSSPLFSELSHDLTKASRMVLSTMNQFGNENSLSNLLSWTISSENADEFVYYWLKSFLNNPDRSKDSLKKHIVNDFLGKQVVLELIEYGLVGDTQLQKDLIDGYAHMDTIIDDTFLNNVLECIKQSRYWNKQLNDAQNGKEEQE